MKKYAVAGLALGALVVLGMPAHAADPVGNKCAFNSATDVTTEPGIQTAVVRGGPLTTPGPGTWTLVCTIQTNQATHAGSGVEVTKSGTDVIVLEPTQRSYPATAADTVSLCTELRQGTSRLYWTGGATPGTGTWGTDPNALCGQAITIDPNPQACPVLLAIDARLGTTLADTWQDCGPYSPII